MYRFPLNHLVLFRFLVLACLLIFVALSFAQVKPVPTQDQQLTRGKMWVLSGETANIGNNQGPIYPAYYGSTNQIVRQQSEVMLYAKTPTQDFLNYGVKIDGWADIPTRLVQNYNFPTDKGPGYGPDQPEEYVYGTAHAYDSNPTDANIPLFWKISTKRMVWSLPKYDDFVLSNITVINNDVVPWTGVYLSWHHAIVPCAGGDKYKNDTEYRWLKDLKTYGEEQGAFVFFDDTSWPNFSDTPAKYLYSPGDVTGDVGDPGNILEVNSLDSKLYTPQVFAEAFLDCTPNADGKKKFWYNIRNSEGSQPWSATAAPPSETVLWHSGGYDQYLSILREEQPRMSWRDARAANSAIAGNSWERTPLMTMGVGPYNLAPGDSINILMIFCGGDWRRDITMKGGLVATRALPDSSITELKKNWAAAIELIENKYKPLAYPPPTCGNPPKLGFGNELQATTFVSVKDDGTSEQGFEISWQPIADDYRDPLRKINDFMGYRVYKSEIGLEGPWEKIAEISKEQATALISGGRVHFKYRSEPGVPTRFGVTSFDSEGLESGMTAYSYDPVAAPRAPKNDLSLVRVVPSPFRQSSNLKDAGEQKRLSFENIPAQCTIRIYTLAGELVKTLEHNGYGSEAWGSSSGNNYMLTRFATNVMPGIYLYHIESHVSGHEGETASGKFAIIK